LQEVAHLIDKSALLPSGVGRLAEKLPHGCEEQIAPIPWQAPYQFSRRYCKWHAKAAHWQPMKAIAIIPARLASTRLPRKMLREIAGQPLLGLVYEAARKSPHLAEVIIATDSEEILQLAARHGWKARMTSHAHRSGTERVHEVSEALAADIYLNIQGDEPLTRREHVDALLEVMQNDSVEVGTLKTPCPKHDVENPNAVKVVTDASGKALYFSRATIPHDRDQTRPPYFKHLGFYGYRKKALDRFCALPESLLERSERLEQLRFLENGIAIYVGETPYDTVGVDTEQDLQRVEGILHSRRETL
jgi:3-deoxy-manno-octulosonate cytidylyltransferase (CMP-KDO synthetase)